MPAAKLLRMTVLQVARDRDRRYVRVRMASKAKLAVQCGFVSEPNLNDQEWVWIWGQVKRPDYVNYLAQDGLPSDIDPDDNRVNPPLEIMSIEMIDGRLAYFDESSEKWFARGRPYRPRNAPPSPVEIEAALMWERGETLVRIAAHLGLSVKQVRFAVTLCGAKRKKKINQSVEKRLARKREALALYRAAKRTRR